MNEDQRAELKALILDVAEAAALGEADEAVELTEETLDAAAKMMGGMK